MSDYEYGVCDAASEEEFGRELEEWKTKAEKLGVVQAFLNLSNEQQDAIHKEIDPEDLCFGDIWFYCANPYKALVEVWTRKPELFKPV